MQKIIFLGTSSSIPTKTRDNTSFLFYRNKTLFLVDCPGSIIQKLMKVGVDFRKLKNVIITHSHPDHIYGIISLIHTQAFFTKRLNIFASKTCIGIIKKLIKLFKLNKKIYPEIKYIDVFKDSIFYGKAGLKISAIKNRHCRQSFGVKISSGGKIIFYSSDTSFSPAMLKEAGKIDYLIHDCTASSYYFSKHPFLFKMHTSAKELADYLKKNKDIKLIPIHFLLWERGEEKRIRNQLKELKPHLVFVKDFESISL